jgi:hypothetical protein
VLSTRRLGVLDNFYLLGLVGAAWSECLFEKIYAIFERLVALGWYVEYLTKSVTHRRK